MKTIVLCAAGAVATIIAAHFVYTHQEANAPPRSACDVRSAEDYNVPKLEWDAPGDVVVLHGTLWSVMRRDSLPCYAPQIEEDEIVILS